MCTLDKLIRVRRTVELIVGNAIIAKNNANIPYAFVQAAYVNANFCLLSAGVQQYKANGYCVHVFGAVVANIFV